MIDKDSDTAQPSGAFYVNVDGDVTAPVVNMAANANFNY